MVHNKASPSGESKRFFVCFSFPKPGCVLMFAAATRHPVLGTDQLNAVQSPTATTSPRSQIDPRDSAHWGTYWRSEGHRPGLSVRTWLALGLWALTGHRPGLSVRTWLALGLWALTMACGGGAPPDPGHADLPVDHPFLIVSTSDGLNSDRVRALHAGRDGSLWIVAEGGIHRYRDGRVEAGFTPASTVSLPDARVSALAADGGGGCGSVRMGGWLATMPAP